MVTSEASICNIALSHLGIGIEIQNLATDPDANAQACRRFYEISRDELLRDFSWPWATKYATLALVQTEPTSEWAYSYRYPSDCISLRRLLSGTRLDTQQSKEPYRVGQDSQGKLIYSDMVDPQIEYTVRVTDVSRFPDDFAMALAFKMAMYLAPRVTKGDPFKLSNRATELYALWISNAKANAGNEETPDQEPDSEFQRARL